MLARANRLVTAEEFRFTLRRGRRWAGRFLVLSAVSTMKDADAEPPQFGFILSRKVGNAVLRNTVRRRLKAIAREQLPQVTEHTRVVVRVLPGAGLARYSELREEFCRGLDRVQQR